ncbi:ionotropic receptor 40a [Ceratitis capitata]|uniref:ionotropic receptor 40a n=1 Tax=Ceratitis capitata TaxID=7213 RepID=UPI000618804F|nr:ionotropic receptor 40a [Ceratitis capitata]
MKVLLLNLILWLPAALVLGGITYNAERNISDVAIALSEIINALKPRQLAILSAPQFHFNTRHAPLPAAAEIPNDSQLESMQMDIDDFIYKLHKLNFKSVIYNKADLFFKFVEDSLLGSIESVNLIFSAPYELSARIQERKLSHRLSLFIFYWGAKHPPKANEVRFEEPMRAVVITRPRKKAFRIYYNQAVPDGVSNLRLVNWYDGDNLGLQKVPLLPNAASVYSNFNGRVFRVPVFHSPPWFWVNYDNDSINSTMLDDYIDSSNSYMELTEVNVTGGRDHCLLNLLAQHMNFQFVYIEAPGRTQGSLRIDDIGGENETFTGGIGLLQNGLADFLLGDVSLSWERRKAVEFSFFTLADSGAFATHAPRRLNEAFAIIRPFKRDVWPYLILTVIFSGPIFYAIIAIPYKWHLPCQGRAGKRANELVFHVAYIREITGDNEMAKRLLRRQRQQQQLLGETNAQQERLGDGALGMAEMPYNLFDKCIWFTVQLFLKQSCKELYHGYRAKFLMIVYWIAATYVLADVYSAQLTSQFARPPHEAPINTLQRLQTAMLRDGYQLFVEKESSSLEMLENGTEIFRQLYALMKQQNPDVEGYLIDSVEAGILLIADGLENKAVLGGRETLYFNIQQFGSKTFQLSHKLYTRYSAVAVQIGCPFLDSLNDVIIHLFEGGILDKMTNAEYATQSRMLGKEYNNQHPTSAAETNGNNEPPPSDDNRNGNGGSTDVGGKADESAGTATKSQDTQIIQPLNLRMLQGAFIVLLCGYAAATVILVLELCCHRLNWNFMERFQVRLLRRYRCVCRNFRRIAHSVFVRVFR